MSAARRLLERQHARRVLYREASCRAASIDEEARTAEFVASTENAVQTWLGPEVLRMSGARLKRFKKNPVVLDSHNAWSIKSILGSAEAWVDGKVLRTKVRFDETPEGEAAWARVKSGSLRAVSIGYRPNRKKTRALQEGETDGDVTGPALVCREWELMEITLCPVPADEDAVRRSFYDHAGHGRNRGGGRRGEPMARMNFSDLPQRQPTDDDDQDAELDDEAHEPEAERAPAPKPKAKPAAKPIARALPALPEEIEERRVAALERSIRRITPKGLEHVADQCVIDGSSLDEARAALNAANAERAKPLGTPDPKDAEKKGDATRDAQLPETLTDDVLARSFEQLRG